MTKERTAEYTKACAAELEVTQCWERGTSHCTAALCCRPGRAPAHCTHPHSFLSGKKTDKAAARAALQLIVETGDSGTFAHEH